MRLLLDSQLLVWAATEPHRLSAEAQELIADESSDVLFSAASIWELTIKSMLDRTDFTIRPRVLRRALIDNGYAELPVASEHALAVDRLPPIHRDPFDRLLVAQTSAEGALLLTADEIVARYPGPIRKV